MCIVCVSSRRSIHEESKLYFCKRWWNKTVHFPYTSVLLNWLKYNHHYYDIVRTSSKVELCFQSSLLNMSVFVTGIAATEGERTGDMKTDGDWGSVECWEEACCLKGEAFPKERNTPEHPVTHWRTPAFPSVHSVKLSYPPQGDTY